MNRWINLCFFPFLLASCGGEPTVQGVTLAEAGISEPVVVATAVPSATPVSESLSLPFPKSENGNWILVSGPHPGYLLGKGPDGAIDLDPYPFVGCSPDDDRHAKETVIASFSGIAVEPITLIPDYVGRRAEGAVVVDTSFGGYPADRDPQTGYAQLYLHVYNPQVVPGQMVEKGTFIGNPSCKGGTNKTTGAHVHFATYLNGVITTEVSYSGYQLTTNSASYLSSLIASDGSELVPTYRGGDAVPGRNPERYTPVSDNELVP